ncbi:MAG: ABC transporter permease [Armatimonadota bacterium]|nr:ABC transporter permease [bacterium]MDW8322322.1 ABC transporter permease [Armatimonadota bacterium]
MHSGVEDRLHRVLERLNDYRGVIALVVVFVLGTVFSPRALDTGLPVFLSWQTQLAILYEYSEYGLLATGMTLVILTGGIDLSVGSVLGLSAVLFSLLTIGYGWEIAPAVAVVLLTGVCCGLINGALIARFKMQPFVATLAMMTAARGAAKLIAGGIKVQPGGQPWYVMQEGTPPFFLWMTSALPGIGVQPSTLIFLLCILVMATLVRYTSYGRWLYAIGGNEEAARLSGIRVGAVKVLTYALCSMFAAMAGVLNACRQDLGDTEAGMTYELDAIAAVVIGGTSLMGGRGGMMFTLIGVLIMAYINKILSLNAVELAPRMVIQGIIITIAVLIQQKRGRT